MTTSHNQTQTALNQMVFAKAARKGIRRKIGPETTGYAAGQAVCLFALLNRIIEANQAGHVIDLDSLQELPLKTA